MGLPPDWSLGSSVHVPTLPLSLSLFLSRSFGRVDTSSGRSEGFVSAASG